MSVDYEGKITESRLKIMREFCNALKDAHSQYTYLALCHASMVGEPGNAPIASWPQYFHPLVHAGPWDIICGGGLATSQVGDFPENITLNFPQGIE